jgi:transposase-like protein
VAKRLGIPEGVLYGWVNKFKKSEQPQSSDLKTLQTEMVKLKAELRRTVDADQKLTIWGIARAHCRRPYGGTFTH